ncbi:MAG: DUF192 domain-containing protein [Oleiphilaceae bacterium]|nr:DUF192 domain-containing protein [Oleiphilaceae bacterium]
MPQWGRRCLLYGLLAALLSGCSGPSRDDTDRGTQLCLPRGDGYMPLSVELATTPEQRNKGLQGRESLGRRSGMLFLYGQPRSPDNGFWMYRTMIPLSLAWLDREGQVLGLQEMRPCSASDSSECPRYTAGVTHQAALEVNAGLFQQLGVKDGRRIQVAAGAADNPCGRRRSLASLFD